MLRVVSTARKRKLRRKGVPVRWSREYQAWVWYMEAPRG